MKIPFKLTTANAKRPKGFTLVELMITVAIIGIIASIALPAYNNYIGRAKIQEGMYFLEKAKFMINVFHQDGGKLSEIRSGNAATFSKLGLKKSINSKYISDYWIGSYTVNEVPHDITIWVMFKPSSGLPSTANGQWPVYLAGKVVNNRIKWVCKSDFAGGAAAANTPVKCR